MDAKTLSRHYCVASHLGSVRSTVRSSRDTPGRRGTQGMRDICCRSPDGVRGQLDLFRSKSVDFSRWRTVSFRGSNSPVVGSRGGGQLGPCNLSAPVGRVSRKVEKSKCLGRPLENKHFDEHKAEKRWVREPKAGGCWSALSVDATRPSLRSSSGQTRRDGRGQPGA